MRIFEPVRVEKSYIQKLHGKPGDIFPLLCPVREAEWAKGWDPLAVFTRSGFAEDNCIFITGDREPESIWVITCFDPMVHVLEIVKFTPGLTVCRIRISLSENTRGETDADVRYMYTAMSDEGAEFVRSYSDEFFKTFMEHMEAALNSFLIGGTDRDRFGPPAE